MVSERSLAVLRVIVQDYVASREPVGSKTIVERHSFGVSAATIRNDMAQLEEEELIAAPHTSSGRVPTDKGYRVFVDQLTELRPLSAGAAPGDRDLPRRSRSIWMTCSPAPCACCPSSPARSRSRSTPRSATRGCATSSSWCSRPTRLMTVLITDTGRVDQQLLDGAHGLDDDGLAELRAAFNSALGGLALADAAATLQGVAGIRLARPRARSPRRSPAASASRSPPTGRTAS